MNNNRLIDREAFCQGESSEFGGNKKQESEGRILATVCEQLLLLRPFPERVAQPRSTAGVDKPSNQLERGLSRSRLR